MSFTRRRIFNEWEERCKPLTDGGWSYQPLHGLEAWFRSPGGPTAVEDGGRDIA